jgi:DNA-directed RNA polymerase specialized sigma24 family protein
MSEQQNEAEFFRRLDEDHRPRISGMIRRKYPSFSAADVEDIWAQAEAELYERLSSTDESYNGRSIGGLISTIAKRRACDLLRKKGREAQLINERGQQAEAELAAEGNGTTASWRSDPELRQELQTFAGEAFRLLSPDERLVLSAYCDNYPDLDRPKKLLEFLTQRFPAIGERNWTPRYVRRLLDKARDVVQDYLLSKGYNLDQEN